jgi:sugar phosphate isomerase/epimerase
MKTCFPVMAPGVKAKIMAMGGNFDSNIILLGQLGFKGIELMIREATAVSSPELKKVLAENNLVVSAVGVAPLAQDKITIASPQVEIRERALQLAKGAIYLAGEFNAPFCIGSFRGSVDDVAEDNRKSDALKAFRTIGQYAHDQGVTVLIEPQNASNGNYLNAVSEVLDWIELIGTGNFKLILDLFHMDACENSIFTALRKAEHHIGLVHLCDSKRRMMGFGYLPVCDFISAILGTGFDGFFSVEVKQDPNSETAAAMSAQFFDYFSKTIL